MTSLPERKARGTGVGVHGAAGLGELSAVGEAVRGHVDDAHNPRPVQLDTGDRALRVADADPVTLAAEAEGAEAKRIKGLIRRAEMLMRQPESSPHDTHFHLSLKKKE